MAGKTLEGVGVSRKKTLCQGTQGQIGTITMSQLCQWCRTRGPQEHKTGCDQKLCQSRGTRETLGTRKVESPLGWRTQGDWGRRCCAARKWPNPSLKQDEKESLKLTYLLLLSFPAGSGVRRQEVRADSVDTWSQVTENERPGEANGTRNLLRGRDW